MYFPWIKYFQKINSILSYLFSNNLNEKKFFKLFFKSKALTYFDIGTNYGTNFDSLKKHIKIQSAYLIEPSKYCYDFLSKKYSNNKNIFISNLAFSNKNGERLFNEFNVKSQSSFYNLKEKANEKNSLYRVTKNYNIETITLDTFCKNNNIDYIDYLKIDAQDEDLNILKGAENLLSNRQIRLIKAEITVNSHYDSNVSGQEIIIYLSKFNYKLINISETKYDNGSLLFFNGFFLAQD